MTGTFVATPSKALTIEHEPTGRELTQFKPEEVRTDLSKIEVLAAYGTKLRDENKLRELAIAKLELVVDIVDWWDRNVYTIGENPNSHNSSGRSLLRGDLRISREDALKTLGYSPKNYTAITRWRMLAKKVAKDTDEAVQFVVHGWAARAGMFLNEPREKKENEDRDLAVESIFRAYTKLDPDQRIELKQKIMDFEKSYKDPFAPKAA